MLQCLGASQARNFERLQAIRTGQARNVEGYFSKQSAGDSRSLAAGAGALKAKIPVGLLERRLDKVRAEKGELEACTVSEGDVHYLLFEV